MTRRPTGRVTPCSTVNPFSISKAYADTVAAHTAAFRMTMDVTTPGAAGSSRSVHMTASGTMDMARALADMTMSVPPVGAMDMRLVGSTMYIQLPAQLRGKLPGGKTWLSMSLQQMCGSGSTLLGGGTGDPSSTLGQFRFATGAGLQNLGSATVDGVQTTHYRATIDMAKAAAAAKNRCPGGLMGQAMQKEAAQIHARPVDLWVDSQDRLRRMQLTETVPVQSHMATTAMTMELSDFGTPVHVTPPPAQDVLDATNLPGQHA